jgi:hypothetical protein
VASSFWSVASCASFSRRSDCRSRSADWKTFSASATGFSNAVASPFQSLNVEVGNEKHKTTYETSAIEDAGGKVAMYQVKYAEMPMDDYPVDGEHWRKNWKDGKVAVTYWNFAKNVVGEPAPQAAGKAEKFSVAVPAGKKLYISVRSFDDSHNRSKMSNVVEVETK